MIVWWSASYAKKNKRFVDLDTITFNSGFYAEDNMDAAKEMAEKRNLGEYDLSPTKTKTGADGLRPYSLVSDAIEKLKNECKDSFLCGKDKYGLLSNYDVLLHGTTFFSFVYARSAKGKHRTTIADETLGDTGYVHDMIHFLTIPDMSFYWWDLMKSSLELELKVPGLLLPEEEESHKKMLVDLSNWSEEEYWNSHIV